MEEGPGERTVWTPPNIRPLKCNLFQVFFFVTFVV